VIPSCGDNADLDTTTSLEINENGFISDLAPYRSSSTSEQIVQIPSGSFILPTFCDLHLHAPQFLFQGTGLHLPLLEWLDKYALKAEERLDSDLALAEKVYRTLAHRLIENGTGAVLLFGTIKSETNLILAKAMQEAGIRAFVGKLSMDISSRPTYREPSAQAALDSAKTFVGDCRALVDHLPSHKRLVEPVLTPRFVPTCSEELLCGLGRLAKEDGGVRIQSHMAESKDMVDLVKAERGVQDTEVFKRNGLLTPHTIQAHCTFLSPSSLTDLSHTQTSIAHCPLSNSYFSAKRFRLREAIDRGVKVGLGSDIAGGYELGIMNAMRLSVVISRLLEGDRIINTGAEELDVPITDDDKNLSIDWKESLYLATKGGAVALGLPEGYGTFHMGAPFDAQLIRIYNPETALGVGPIDLWDLEDVQFSLTEELVEKWWCLGDTRNRASVWVQGQKLR